MLFRSESCVQRGSLEKLLCGQEAPDPETKPACNLHLHLLLATQSKIVHSVRPLVVLSSLLQGGLCLGSQRGPLTLSLAQ